VHDTAALFAPLGILHRDQYANNGDPKPFGFLYTRDHTTAIRVHTELSTKEYRMGVSCFKVADNIESRDGHRLAAVLGAAPFFPDPLQDWPRALATFKQLLNSICGYCILIRDIPVSVMEEHIIDLTDRFGAIRQVNLKIPAKARFARAYVALEIEAAARAAVKHLKGHEMKGQRLVVEHYVQGEVAKDGAMAVTVGSDLLDKHDDGPPKLGPVLPASSSEVDLLDLNDGDGKELGPVLLPVSAPAANSSTVEQPAAPTTSEEQLTASIIRMGTQLMAISRAVQQDSKLCSVEDMDEVAQLMSENASIREAVQKLLDNEKAFGGHA
jgi:hypothetical protein